MPKLGERYICERREQEVNILKPGHRIPPCSGYEIQLRS